MCIVQTSYIKLHQTTYFTGEVPLGWTRVESLKFDRNISASEVKIPHPSLGRRPCYEEPLAISAHIRNARQLRRRQRPLLQTPAEVARVIGLADVY